MRKISSEYVIQDNILYHLGKENRFFISQYIEGLRGHKDTQRELIH